MPPKRTRGDGDILAPGTGVTYAKRARAAPKALAPKARKRNYKAAYKLSKPFKQVLNTFLDKDNQTHWVTGFIRDQVVQPLPTLGNAGPIGLMSLIPKVVQAGVPTIGSTSGMTNNIESREGSMIRMKSLNVGVSLRLNPKWHIDDEHATAIRYKVVLLSCKKVTAYNLMVDGYFGTGGFEEKQFKDGAQPAKWDKYMSGFDHPVNSDLFTVHDIKTGTLARGLVNNNAQGDAASVRVPNCIHNFTLKVKCKSKILKYEEPGSTLPTNFQPFLWIGWKSYDGYDWISASPQPTLVEMVGNVRMSFDDMT